MGFKNGRVLDFNSDTTKCWTVGEETAKYSRLNCVNEVTHITTL